MLILSQCAIYLASSAKSNSATEAIGKAMAWFVSKAICQCPPASAMFQPNLMKDMNYGKGYKYSHAFEGNFSEQEYLPEKMRYKILRPGRNARRRIKKILKSLWKDKYGY